MTESAKNVRQQQHCHVHGAGLVGGGGGVAIIGDGGRSLRGLQRVELNIKLGYRNSCEPEADSSDLVRRLSLLMGLVGDMLGCLAVDRWGGWLVEERAFFAIGQYLPVFSDIFISFRGAQLLTRWRK